MQTAAGPLPKFDTTKVFEAMVLPAIGTALPALPAVSASVAVAAAIKPARERGSGAAPTAAKLTTAGPADPVAAVRKPAGPAAPAKYEDDFLTELLNAARAGKAAAQVDLGRRYENGDRVARDLGLAATWYGRAAEQGNAFAQSSLGYLYIKGAGVPKDPVQAHKWFSLAAAQNYASAADARDAIEGGMEPDDIESARRLAASWTGRHGASDAVDNHGFGAQAGRQPVEPAPPSSPRGDTDAQIR